MGKQRQEWKEWLLRTLGVVWSAFMGKFVVKWQVWQERLVVKWQVREKWIWVVRQWPITSIDQPKPILFELSAVLVFFQQFNIRV